MDAAGKAIMQSASLVQPMRRSSWLVNHQSRQLEALFIAGLPQRRAAGYQSLDESQGFAPRPFRPQKRPRSRHLSRLCWVTAVPWHVPQLPKEAGRCQPWLPAANCHNMLIRLHHGSSFSRPVLSWGSPLPVQSLRTCKGSVGPEDEHHIVRCINQLLDQLGLPGGARGCKYF